MNKIIKDLQKIKNLKLNALERTSYIIYIAKKYNMFSSDVFDLYFKIGG